MSEDRTNLMQHVYDYCLQMFHQQSGTAPSNATFLSFLPFGEEISSDMFKPQPTDTTYSQQMAIEWFSDEVNSIPDISADVFTLKGTHVDEIYEMLLIGSQFADGGNNNLLFSKVKADAGDRFEIKLPYLYRKQVGPEDVAKFHPAYASPNDWYDPGIKGNWTTYNSDQSVVQTQAGTGTLPSLRPIRPLTWRVLPEMARPILENPRLLPQLMTTPEKVADLSAGISITHISPTLIAPKLMMGMDPTTLKSATVVRKFQPWVMAKQRVPLIINNTTPQPVTTNKIQVRFSYCLVTIDRPWLSHEFLAIPGWYISGYHAGWFSTGTTENNTGAFPAIPIACLLVKDLQITANWTDNDANAVQRAAAFGPFSLVGRTVEGTSSALSLSGIQILGWICQTMPCLPPLSAPDTP